MNLQDIIKKATPKFIYLKVFLKELNSQEYFILESNINSDVFMSFFNKFKDCEVINTELKNEKLFIELISNEESLF